MLPRVSDIERGIDPFRVQCNDGVSIVIITMTITMIIITINITIIIITIVIIVIIGICSGLSISPPPS